MADKVAVVVEPKMFELECPYCGEALKDPRDGSYLVKPEGLRRHEKLRCEDCGLQSELPIRLKRIGNCR